MKLTRRDMLKISGTSIGGGLLLASPLGSLAYAPSNAESTEPSERNTLYDLLPVFPLGEQLDANQMRITFLGTSCIPRLSQECNSVYVEVGSGDQFVFNWGLDPVCRTGGRRSSQTWMAENLAFLPAVSHVAKGSDSLKHYYVYDYDDSLVGPAKSTDNYKIHGVLYNWPAAMNAEDKLPTVTGRNQAVCPAGWHMPEDAEWKELEIALGMSQYDADTIYLRSSGDVGKKLKSYLGWINSGNGSNFSGFTALPGGYRNTHGDFRSIDNYALYWTASLSDTLAYYRSLSFNDNGVYRIPTLKSHGLSVRCVRD
jgi:uncharacterized protein (TIGR02145 family)